MRLWSRMQSCGRVLKQAGKATVGFVKKVAYAFRFRNTVPALAALGIAGTVLGEFGTEVIAADLGLLWMGLADGGATFAISLTAAAMSGALAAIQETVFAIDGDVFTGIGEYLDECIGIHSDENKGNESYHPLEGRSRKAKITIFAIGGAILVCVCIDGYTTQNTLFEENNDISTRAAKLAFLTRFLDDKNVRTVFARFSGSMGGAKIIFEDITAFWDLLKPALSQNKGFWQRWIPHIARWILSISFPLLATIEWLALVADGTNPVFATLFALISMCTDGFTFYFITGNNSKDPNDLTAFEQLGRWLDRKIARISDDSEASPFSPCTRVIVYGGGAIFLAVDAFTLFITEFEQTQQFLESPEQPYNFFRKYALPITATHVTFYFLKEFAENVSSSCRLMQLTENWMRERSQRKLGEQQITELTPNGETLGLLETGAATASPTALATQPLAIPMRQTSREGSFTGSVYASPRQRSESRPPSYGTATRISVAASPRQLSSHVAAGSTRSPSGVLRNPRIPYDRSNDLSMSLNGEMESRTTTPTTP